MFSYSSLQHSPHSKDDNRQVVTNFPPCVEHGYYLPHSQEPITGNINMNIISTPFFFCSAKAQHGHRPHLIGEVTKTHIHTHLLGLLWIGDQLVSETATYMTLNTRERPTPIPSWGFQPMVPAFKQLHTYSYSHQDQHLQVS